MFYKTNYSVPCYKFSGFPQNNLSTKVEKSCFRRYIFMPHLLRGSSSPVVSNHWGYVAASYFPKSYFQPNISNIVFLISNSHPNICHRLTFKNPLSLPWPFFQLLQTRRDVGWICDCLNVQFFRHDCQDGSDENDCDYSHLAVNKNFFCFKWGRLWKSAIPNRPNK